MDLRASKYGVSVDEIPAYEKGMEHAANVALKSMEKMVVANPLDRQRLLDAYYEQFFTNQGAK